jgi:biopolymer transport protein ExbD
MAVSLGDGDDGVLAEINITPMIDVLLCMLIIFVVASPQTPNEQTPMKVPREAATQGASDPNATLLLTVNEDGTGKLGTQALSSKYPEIVAALQANEKAQTDGKIAIKGEGKVTYGQVMKFMSAAHEAGIADVGVASDRF